MTDQLERDGFASYGAYLRSSAWRVRRDAALARALSRCQVCNGDQGLNVHHRTYERIGRELESDLTVLCRSCHELFHESRPPEIAADIEREHRRERLVKALEAVAFDGAASLEDLYEQGFHPEELLACGLAKRTSDGDLVYRYAECTGIAWIEHPDSARVVAIEGVLADGTLVLPPENELYHREMYSPLAPPNRQAILHGASTVPGEQTPESDSGAQSQ